MAGDFQQQKGRHEAPGGERRGDSERKSLKRVGEAGLFDLGRRLVGQEFLPRRERPAAQPQGEDAKGRRNLDPSGVDRPGPRREAGKEQRHDEAGDRRENVRRERASPVRKRMGEAHQSPEQQCDEEVRRHAETPLMNRRLTQTGRKTIMIR
jgi:hypothetical protein